MLLQANRSCQRLVTSRLIQQGLMVQAPQRYFSDAALSTAQPQDGNSVEAQYAQIGANSQFSEQKHAQVLTFPWNFLEIIEKFEAKHKIMGVNSYWPVFVHNTRAVVQMNKLFRVFHQSCALNDQEGIKHTCEGKLAHAVNQSLDIIHFHSLDIEIANLRVDQIIKVLKVEISHGLNIERSKNIPKDAYNVVQSSIMGAPANFYTLKSTQPSFLDFSKNLTDHTWLPSQQCLNPQ